MEALPIETYLLYDNLTLYTLYNKYIYDWCNAFSYVQESFEKALKCYRGDVLYGEVL